MEGPLSVKIMGVGRYLPERVVTNEELEKQLGLEAGWIEQHQGVCERRWVNGESATSMGAAAGREAVADAGLALSDIDLILNASGTPVQAIPDGGPLLQRELGMGDSGTACMSCHATCLSFLVALDMAALYVACGRFRHVLIVSSDISSVALDWQNPKVYTLFGDGAAAVVLGPSPPGEKSAIKAVAFETYGNYAGLARISGMGTRRPPQGEDTVAEDHFFQMDGTSIYKQAIRRAPAFLERLRPGLSKGPGEIQVVVPHQASKLSLIYHSHRLNIPEDRLMVTLDKLGNCVAASLPLTLFAAIKEQRLARGQDFLLLGTGAGLSIGGMILTY
jgi:3-oxoacyl-[acyl-carrier-protein] synthase III